MQKQPLIAAVALSLSCASCIADQDEPNEARDLGMPAEPARDTRGHEESLGEAPEEDAVGAIAGSVGGGLAGAIFGGLVFGPWGWVLGGLGGAATGGWFGGVAPGDRPPFPGGPPPIHFDSPGQGKW